MEKLEMTWITGWDEILSAEIRQIWLNHYTLDGSATVFQHPQMGEGWLRTHMHSHRIEPVFCLLQNQFISIFYPLVLWHRNGKNCHQKLVIPVGFPEFDYLNPLVIASESSVFPSDFYQIVSNDLIHKFRADAICFSGISGTLKKSGFGTRISRQVCPISHLNRYSCFDNFLSGLKSSLRGDINRQRRNLEQEGELSLFVYKSDDKDSISKSLNQLLMHRALRWPNAFTVPEFYPEMVGNMLDSGHLHFSELKVGDKVLSRHLGFVHRNRFYYYLPASSPWYSRFSPGKIHLYYLHKWAFENKISIFDYLRGDEAYKRSWSDSCENVLDLSVSSHNPVSLIKNSWVNAKDKIKILLS